MSLVALLVACSTPGVFDDALSEDVSVSLWLDGTPNRTGGALVVQTSFLAEGELSPPVPVATGLEFEPDGPPSFERLGGHEVLRQRYVFRGKAGMYEIPPLIATWTGPDGTEAQSETAPVWVDLGVDAPEVGELADIVEPSAVWTIPWTPILAVSGAALLSIGGLAVAFARPRRRKEQEVIPEAPDIVAIRSWEAVRDDEGLSSEEKAEALSRLFRVYIEAVLAFEATAWTTTEIMARLRDLGHLPEGNVPRAKRLLRATDRVKFAEHRPGADLFEDLDADLRAFVGSTRPSAWRTDQEAP